LHRAHPLIGPTTHRRSTESVSKGPITRRFGGWIFKALHDVIDKYRGWRLLTNCRRFYLIQIQRVTWKSGRRHEELELSPHDIPENKKVTDDW
jgi:hypothetical protein